MPANMIVPSPQQAKLQKLLRELFQLDQPDLDFGLYRIMHAKSREIESFIEHDLLDKIREKVGENKEEKIAQAKAAYERKRQSVIDDDGDPDKSKQVQQALAEYQIVQESQGEDTELYDHLYRFFERYYEGGDFLSRRYYARETSEKAAPYSVPYDGSEVYLHWANKDQYYIKTTESFRQFSVDLALAQAGDKQLFDDTTPRKVHFSLVEVEQGEHNNVKAASDKDRYFILDADAPIEWQGDELTVRFHYRADTDKAGQSGKWREARNSLNEQGIMHALTKQAQGTDTQATLAQEYIRALALEIPKGKDGTQTLLGKYLNQYTAKNSMDYFIHKNLGAFLKRELDFYIKNELFRLDDLGNADAPNPQQLEKLLKKALTLRDVAHKLIEFLAQTEEFQKKLWLKKKFVVDTQWLVTLDKVPAELYAQIEANDGQWAEWEKLGFVGAKAKRKELLNPDSKLVLDTQFYSTNFTAQLLASIPNLDEATDGVLVHSENFQALNLMQARYREQVKCIYIDPPYNTGSDGFKYKDAYQHSCWLSLIIDRAMLSKALSSDVGVFFGSIDDNEVSKMRMLINDVFGAENFVAQLVWKKKYTGGKHAKFYADFHEYILVFARSAEKISGFGIDRTEEETAKFSEIDEFVEERGKFYTRPLKSNLEKRTTLIYPIIMPDGEPLETQWLVGEDRFKREFAEKRIIFRQKKNGEWQVYKKYYQLDGGGKTKPPSLIERFPNTEAKGELKALFNVQEGRDNVFYTVKPVHLIKHLLEPFLEYSDICLDCYSGSGTTGHAVINLNREDQGKRKYLLVEMGDYFDTVLKPRIAKVVYSADWKDGKPTAPETGISQLVKVIRLESYEDTLNNLQVTEESAQRKVIEANPALREAYFLHYLLELETQGSPSLLNAAAFTDPTAYTLNIKKPGSDVQERRAVDFLETFNWLLGLRVSKLHVPQTFTAKFVREVDAELPAGDAQGRMVVKDFVPKAGEDRCNWWFRAVQGIVQGTGASERVQRVLVVWRKLTGNLEQDNLVLEAYLREVLAFDVRKAQDAVPFDVVYVNDSHALPAMPSCEVRQLEEAFHRLMWDVQDV